MITIEKRIVIDVMKFRRPINLYLQKWLDELKHCKNYMVNIVEGSYDICTARRQSLKNFVNNFVPKGWDYLLQFDDDICPVPSSENILTYHEPLIYLGQANQNKDGAHYGDDDFGCSASRIHKSLATRMDIATSYDFKFNEDRTLVTDCECHTFYNQAKKLGFKSRMVGVIGHEVRQIIVPTEDGIKEWKYIK